MALSITAFVGLSIDDILAIEAAAIASVKGGGNVISWSSAGSSVSKQIDGSPSEALMACNYAKRQLMPAVYGTNVTRTSVAFRSRNGDKFTGEMP